MQVSFGDNILKKSIVMGFMIILLSFSLNQQLVQGHDPADVRPEYHYADQILEVWVFHPVFYPDVHWVNNIQIRKNNALVGNYSYDSQPDDDFTYNYSISAIHFDILKVRVFCNYQGDTEVEIMVLDPENPTTRLPTDEFGLPFMELLFITSSIIAIILRCKRNKK